MCGVFAFFLNRPLNDADLELGRAGTSALAHRGPDASGEWIDRAAGVYLGHRRLAIIDLTSASAQPMCRNGNVISYNGEIYNYRNLRERLKGIGEEFRSAGDVEVLMSAWDRFGLAALDMVDGMLAFALWDGEKATLAVDRFGEKQLYVAETAQGVYVSSELLPLVQLLKPSMDFSNERLTEFLALGYVRTPETAYKEIKRLPAGSTVEVLSGRLGSFKQYWCPHAPLRGKGPVRKLSESTLDLIQEKLIESVVGRLEADVPSCLFLSSGVDSALIAAIIARELGKTIPTVTVGFPGGQIHDEAEHAAEVAAYLGLPNLTVTSDDDQYEITPQYLFEIYGQPNDNVTFSSIGQMARAARDQGFKLGLTGMGGDEIFLGYSKHDFFYKRHRIYNSPEYVRLAAGRLLAPFESINSTARIFGEAFDVWDHERFLALKNLPAIRGLRTLPAFDAWARSVFTPTAAPMEEQAVEFDIRDTMVNSQLPALDFGSMQASHELRTPFLNKSIHDIVADLDCRALLAFGQKSILRSILARYLPKSMTDRPKRGFKFPVDRFLTDYRTPVELEGLPADTAITAWSRANLPGWKRLKLRSVLAREFVEWQKQAHVSSVADDAYSPHAVA